MKQYVKTFESFEKLLEYNSEHKDYVLSNQDKFTIAYEVELSARSHFESPYDLVDSFEGVFKSLLNKYDINTETDNSLTDTSYYTGVEMVPEDYFNGITHAFQFLDDFYAMYNKQKQFFFSKKTGLHINIGYKGVTQWNVVKGYLLLNDDFSYKGFEDRKQSHYAASFKQEFKDKAAIKLMKKFPEMNSIIYKTNITEIESILTDVIKSIARARGDKHIGFNINKLDTMNYVEFRYPGGVLSIDAIKGATINYCNIIQAMADPNYRRVNYFNKLSNFVESLYVKA